MKLEQIIPWLLLAVMGCSSPEPSRAPAEAPVQVLASIVDTTYAWVAPPKGAQLYSEIKPRHVFDTLLPHGSRVMLLDTVPKRKHLIHGMEGQFGWVMLGNGHVAYAFLPQLVPFKLPNLGELERRDRVGAMADSLQAQGMTADWEEFDAQEGPVQSLRLTNPSLHAGYWLGLCLGWLPESYGFAILPREVLSRPDSMSDFARSLPYTEAWHSHGLEEDNAGRPVRYVFEVDNEVGGYSVAIFRMDSTLVIERRDWSH